MPKRTRELKPTTAPDRLSIDCLAELIANGQVTFSDADEAYDRAELFRLIRQSLRRQMVTYIAEVIARDIRRE